jgi:hypothetical protein
MVKDRGDKGSLRLTLPLSTTKANCYRRRDRTRLTSRAFEFSAIEIERICDEDTQYGLG